MMTDVRQLALPFVDLGDSYVVVDPEGFFLTQFLLLHKDLDDWSPRPEEALVFNHAAEAMQAAEDTGGKAVRNVWKVL